MPVQPMDLTDVIKANPLYRQPLRVPVGLHETVRELIDLYTQIGETAAKEKANSLTKLMEASK